MQTFKNKISNIRFLFAVFSLLFVFGCGKNDLPQFNQLSKIRVMALTTPTPEVNPGTTVTITPVISDITATATDTLTDSVAACIDIGVAYGVLPTCDNNPSKVVIHANRTLALPGQTESWTGSADSFSVTVPATGIIFYNRSAMDQYNGINYLIEYTLRSSQGSEVKSFRRIVVSDTAKANKNQNPPMTDIFSDGLAMISLNLGGAMQLSTDLSAGSAEAYSLQLSDGSMLGKSEYLSITWFMTDGETKRMRTDVGVTNAYTAPSSMPSGRSVYILAVARDNRGGVSVVKKKF